MGVITRLLPLWTLTLWAQQVATVTSWRPANYGHWWDSRRPTVCDIRCCKTYPHCAQATSVTCSCSLLTVRSGLFPTTVVNVTISGAQTVDIASNAISSLRQLQQLIVTGVGGITVQRDGLLRPRIGATLNFGIFNAGSVVIRGSAFSGWWDINSRVRIENIRHVTVEQDGFFYLSSFLGPTVRFVNVDSLELEPAAIAAPIGALHMENLTMPACHPASIGSSVQHLVLNAVTIKEIWPGCLDAARNYMKKMYIGFSSFDVVQNNGFKGNIVEVIITSTHIISIQTNGFQLQVDKLQINQSHIDTLEPSGITVSAKTSILLNAVTVQTLRRHALIGLTGEGAAGASTSSTSIRLQTLRVERSAEPGSLALAECAPVEVLGLHVVPQRPRECPTERWTRKLVGVSEGIPLDRVQFQIYQQLAATKPCTEDQWQPVTAADVDDSRCADDSGRRTSTADGRTHAAGERTSTSGRRTSTPGGRTHPAGGRTHTAGGKTSTAGGRTSTAGGRTYAAGGKSSTAGGRTSTPGGRTSTAGGRTYAAGGKSSTAGGRTSTPGERTYPAGGRTHAAGERTSTSGGRTSTVRPGQRLEPPTGARPPVAPTVPGVSKLPGTPGVSGVSELPGTPGVSGVSELPGTTAVPSVSESPASAAAPGARWPLPLGLALAGALVLALGAAGLLLVRRLRLRASPPTAAPSAEGRRDRSTGGRSTRECPQRGDCPAADSSTLHPPEVCDYAEPLRAAPPVDGDYAEIPPPADYASPISAREDAATNFGDYAQIPGSTDYAVPVTFAEYKVTTCEDYAEILRPAEVTSAVSATKVMAANSGDYAEIPGLADCAPTAILRTGDAAGYAEIPCSLADGASPASATADLVAGGEGRAPTPPSSDGGPPAAGGSGSVAESVPPPVPPATAERLQMADELAENPLYVSTLDVGKNEIESSHSDG